MKVRKLKMHRGFFYNLHFTSSPFHNNILKSIKLIKLNEYIYCRHLLDFFQFLVKNEKI